MATVRIGISGWRYAPWRGTFYPEDLPQKDELSYAASKFPTVEINGSFYSLQRPSSYQRWYAQTPANFVFGEKAAGSSPICASCARSRSRSPTSLPRACWH
jgi:uncharacterized protein YecE (DUF72 family)